MEKEADNKADNCQELISIPFNRVSIVLHHSCLEIVDIVILTTVWTSSLPITRWVMRKRSTQQSCNIPRLHQVS